MPDVPILTTDVPQTGNYTPVGMVWAQCSISKGAVSDRILEGMADCIQQIRAQAVLMNADEIFAARVNIAEAGRHRGLIVVQINATAVTVQSG